MEYLVTMTTHVPNGTSDQTVADIRAQEAAHTHQLGREGNVLRLWRPPLEPGEWRTIGLFCANDSADLEQILVSMPLRIWRTDEVTALGPHPNDPGHQPIDLDLHSSEFLTTFVAAVPPGTSASIVESVLLGERRRTRELADQGHLVRLWSLPGQGRALGHWQARDIQAMQAMLQSLPMAGWLSVETVQLSRHPNDPATADLDGAHLSTARPRPSVP